MQLTVSHISGLKKGAREVFTSYPIVIGRLPSSNLQLAVNDTRASARHAEINLEGDSLFLKDLGSTNGTFLNGKRIDRVKLVSGDIIEFGIDGPKLRFEFIKAVMTETENAPKKPLAAPEPPQSSVGPPPLAVRPAAASSDSLPKYGIPNQNQGQELAVAPPTLPPTPGASLPPLPIAIEEREFAYKSRIKYALMGAGAAFIVASILLFIYQALIWTVPAGLMGLFLLLMGWSCWRINITANNQGIYYQGILKSKMIRWEDVIELRVFKSRTRLLTHLVYIVHGRNGDIVFAADDYEDGLELANLISRRARLKW